MKVFISWSGELSKAVALALREWLPSVIQALEPCVSSEDIEKGARWSSDIAKELTNTRAGIVCITPDNLEAPWLNFEAGALSKTVENTMVCTYLFRVKPSQLKGPLVQFQASETNKEDTWKLLSTLNRASQPKPLSESSLSETFKLWWPKLEERLASITTIGTQKTQRRTSEDMLEELIDTTREQARVTKLVSEQLQLQQLYNQAGVRFTSPTGPFVSAPYEGAPKLIPDNWSPILAYAADFAKSYPNTKSNLELFAELLNKSGQQPRFDEFHQGEDPGDTQSREGDD